MKAGIYGRVSTAEQPVENQLHDARRYTEARGCEATEFIERGVSGAKESRPELKRLLHVARQRQTTWWWSGALIASDVGDVLELPDERARMLVAEQWATPERRQGRKPPPRHCERRAPGRTYSDGEAGVERAS